MHYDYMIQNLQVYNSSRSTLKKIIFAINNYDAQGIKYIIENVKTPDDETLSKSIGLFAFAYNKDFLDGVSLLGSFGLRYHPVTLSHSHPVASNLSLYENHLEYLKGHVSISTYTEAYKLLKAIVNPPIAQYSIGNCINYPATIANFTHTDNVENSSNIYEFLSSIYKSNNQIVKNAFIPIAVSVMSPHTHKVSIYVTIAQSSEKYPSYISDFSASNKEIIYIPIEKLQKYQAGILVHEFKHTVNQILFNNSASPYHKSNFTLQNSYHEAIKKTVLLVLELFNGHIFLKKIAQSLYTDEGATDLKYFNFLKTASYTPLMLFKYKSESNNYKFIDDAYNVFSPSANKEDSFDTKKSFVSGLYNKFVEKYNLNEYQLELLDRVSECITRPPEDVDSEMIVRVGELYAKGLNETSLGPLKPLEEYELLVISPEANKFKASIAFQECFVDLNVTYETQTNVIGDSKILY